jgi:hypothetical protein
MSLLPLLRRAFGWYYDSSFDVGKPKFVKQIPLNISEIFQKPLSLAVWFLDDGS